MKQRTLAVLSALPEPVIELLRRALRGETVDVKPLWNVTLQSSRMQGGAAARVLCQGSKDYSWIQKVRRWSRCFRQ